MGDLAAELAQRDALLQSTQRTLAAVELGLKRLRTEIDGQLKPSPGGVPPQFHGVSLTRGVGPRSPKEKDIDAENKRWSGGAAATTTTTRAGAAGGGGGDGRRLVFLSYARGDVSTPFARWLKAQLEAAG